MAIGDIFAANPVHSTGKEKCHAVTHSGWSVAALTICRGGGGGGGAGG